MHEDGSVGTHGQETADYSAGTGKEKTVYPFQIGTDFPQDQETDKDDEPPGSNDVMMTLVFYQIGFLTGEFFVICFHIYASFLFNHTSFLFYQNLRRKSIITLL